MKAQLFGAALGAGAQDQRTRWAARSLFEQGLTRLLQEAGLQLAPSKMIESEGEAAFMEALPLISAFNARLCEQVFESLADGHFPIVLGGDHSVAVGTWSAFAAYRNHEPAGLIWIDAHMDSHTPETSETGAVHGMPMAALLGFGDRRLTHIGGAKAKFKPENVCMLGVRSYESGEAKLLNDLGVRIYGMDEIRHRGFSACLDEATLRMKNQVKRWGVTLDLDAFDPREIPAIGSPVSEGLFFDEVFAPLLRAMRNPSCQAFELVEYNPSLDSELVVFQKIVQLLVGIGRAKGLEVPPMRQPSYSLYMK